ncbi:MAG: OmpH family outer membrane protein [Planctomycetota bacterium]|nr:OmpH family outer membrane protein [Planctomycetota bacterium]
MHRIERVAIYTILALLGITALAQRPVMTSTADAEPSRLQDVLGPVDRVILRGTEGDINLAARKNGVGWGERATDRSWTIGCVDVPRLVSALMNSERFTKDLRALQREAEEQNRSYEERFAAFQEEAGALTPEDPEFPEAQARFQAMMQEYQQWQQGTMGIQQKLGAEQVEAAYRELVEAVDIVAEREGIELVMRFVPVGDPFEVETLDLAGDQVRRRLFLRYPDSIDITARVEAELGL